MSTFKISCSWEVYAVAHVEADSLEQAIKIAERDDFPLPDDPNYVDASFEIDTEISELLNEEV